MRKSWYYRLLFSYMPVFLLIISFLFFIFFQVLSDRARQDTARIYSSINNQTLQSIEQSLVSIDVLMVTKQTRNSNLSDFNMIHYFDQQGQPDAYFTYQVNKEFNNMRQLSPLIYTIYLVRESDGFVLSTNTVSPLEKFADREFIDELLKDSYSYHWTDPRKFKEFKASREVEVISLARKYVTGRGESGLMVVNVMVDAIQQLVAQRLDPSVSYVDIRGKDGRSMFSEDEGEGRRTSMSTIVSDYTGWTYESGLVNASGFSIAQTFSGIWIAVALAVVLLGLGSIIYMTNRHYKPLRSLISQLEKLSSAKLDQTDPRSNEFHYIETTFHALVERFNVFKSQSDLNISYRKKSIFLEVMNGTRSLTNEEWVAEMDRHGFAGGFNKAAVLVVSIDKFPEIRAQYTEQDLILYRFIIQNIYAEWVQKNGFRCWSEWMSDREMCVFVYVPGKKQGGLREGIVDVTELALDWIRKNLPFTVTVGVGQATDEVPKLKDSFKSAMEAINYRLVLGNDRTIGYWETAQGSSVELYHHLEAIRSTVYSFRLMEETEWRTKYGTIYHNFKENRLKRDDIVNLLNYLIYHLFKNIQSTLLNDEMLETNKTIMQDVIEQFDTLEDVQEELLEIMEKLEYRMLEKARQGSANVIVVEMKQYIDEQLSNPDLSLVHLSQQFNIPSKNVSALFKEHFDIKFIDFLIHRRVELAKQLLADTELSVQEVGHKVGYLNPVSFNRVFKRIVGVPPGDYRKESAG